MIETKFLGVKPTDYAIYSISIVLCEHYILGLAYLV